MELTSLLDKFRSLYLNYGICTIKNLFLILGAILQAKTVNLYALRDEIGKLLGDKKTKVESHYRRLTRFFVDNKDSELWSLILRFGYVLLGENFKYLYVDGTEWKIGLFKVHILVLAADILGVAVPLYFKVYEHKGVLSEVERMAFIKSCSLIYDLKDKVLIADREFIGDEWFSVLVALGCDFVIRIRKNQYCHSGERKHSYEKTRQRALRKGKASMLITTLQGSYRLWMVRNEQPNQKELLVYLLTSLVSEQDGDQVYKFRWKIEYCFKHLKTNGFRLEDLNLKDINKIRLLVAIVILAYIVCIYQAFHNRKKEPVRKKKYKDGSCYDEISLFKQGASIVKQEFKSLKELLIMLLKNRLLKRKTKIVQ